MLESHDPAAIDRILAAAVAMLILLAIAATAPFLGVRQFGLGYDVTLPDAAEALAAGGMAPLGLFLILAVLALPAFRAAAHLYALTPPRLGLAPLPGAARAFRMAGRVRDWAMAEVFLIGCAVSLIKLQSMANVALGPAFWALAATVLALALEGASRGRDAAWDLIAPEPRDG